MPIFIVGSILLLLSSFAQGGVIRSVQVNDQNMQTIRLRLGQSTVLRFLEKPKKVVIGNQNYYHVEFIENDLTIQPQGSITTNLFVYGEYHVYGFLLKVCTSCLYDDLVNIRWKPKRQLRQVIKKNPTDKKRQKIGKVFRVGKILAVNLVEISYIKARKMYAVDIAVTNLTKESIKSEEIKFLLTRGGRPLANQKYLFKKERFEGNTPSLDRFFVKLEEKKGFTINATYKGVTGKHILSRSFL